MSKNSKLSTYLESLSSTDLMKEIKNLHRLFPDVREHYQIQLSENGEEELLAQYKKIIKDEFLPGRGWGGDARLSVARKAVNDFVKLSKNPLNKADILLYYVEIGVQYTNNFGDINEPFYASMENMYEKAALYVQEQNLEYMFTSRFKKIVEDTDGIGWGFYDNLLEMFLEFFPDVPIRSPR